MELESCLPPFEQSSRHDTQHEFSKQWHGEFRVAMGRAVDHALFQESGSQGCDGLDFDAKQLGDVTRPLRAIAQFSDSPASCVARLNDLLAADNEEMMFVTLFYAIFDTRDGSLIYANAGHNLPYLLRADGRIEVVPGTHGIALAVLPDFDFQEGRLMLEPGDGLFLYTDGVTEAMDSREQLYGDARLMVTLSALRQLPVREIPGRMVELIKEYETGVAQADDITCLMARYRGPA